MMKASGTQDAPANLFTNKRAKSKVRKKMSDLQDIIARSSILAFNAGYKQGRQDERNLILEMAKEAQCHVRQDEVGEYVYLSDLIEYLEAEDAKAKNQPANQG